MMDGWTSRTSSTDISGSRRADLLSKLDGLSEYDARRPMTSTGTNLLGLVKHVASVEVGYFGDVFGRPSPAAPWFDDDANVGTRTAGDWEAHRARLEAAARAAATTER